MFVSEVEGMFLELKLPGSPGSCVGSLFICLWGGSRSVAPSLKY